MAFTERRINLSVRLPNGEIKTLQTSSKSTVDQVKRELLKAALIDFAQRKDYVVVLCEDGQIPLDVEFRRFLESHPSMEKVEEGQTINLALLPRKVLDSKGKPEDGTSYDESAPSPRPSLSSSNSTAVLSTPSSIPQTTSAPNSASASSSFSFSSSPAIPSLKEFELSQQVKELQGKIEELEVLRKENAELKKRLQTAVAAESETRGGAEIERLLKEIEVLKTVKEAQDAQEKKKLRTIQEENTQLRADLEKAIESSSSFSSSELTNLQREANALRQQVEALTATNQTLVSEEQQLVEKENKDDVERTREFMEELNTFKEQHTLLVAEKETLQRQLEEKEKKVSALQSEVNNKDSLLKERAEVLNQQMEILKSQFHELKEESTAPSSSATNEVLLKELDALKQLNKSLEEEKAQRTQQPNEEALQHIQEEARLLREEKAKLEEENKKTQELQEELQRLKEEKGVFSFKTTPEATDSSAVALQEELRQMKEEKERLEADNAKLRSAGGDPQLIQALLTLRGESERLTSELSQLEKQLRASQETSEELRISVEERESHLLAGEEALKEVVVLRPRVEELEQKNSRLEESLHTKTEELAKAAEDARYLEESKEAFVDEIEKYENALKTIQHQMVDAEGKRQKICGLLEKIESELHVCYQSKQAGLNNTHPVNGKQVLRRMYTILTKIRDSHDFNMSDFTFIEHREKKRPAVKKAGTPKRPGSATDAGPLQKVGGEGKEIPLILETPAEQQPSEEKQEQHEGADASASGPAVTTDIEVSLHSGGLDPKWRVNYADVSLSRVIGEGAFGQVYKGTFRTQEVAIKLIKIGAETPDFKEDFVKEVTFLSTLDHPNIVKFVGVCTEEPNLAILTQYAAKGSLSSMLRSEKIRLPWTLRLKFCIDVACGMNYLHSLSPKIIHRDLKSDNILINEDLVAQVADFGLAKLKTNTFRRETSKRNLLQMLTKQNSYINVITGAVGTPAWIAPEILSWQPYNEKADIYSYGMFLWEVWCQKIPMSGKSQYSLMMDVMTLGERPDIPADCPAKYSELISICWDQNATKRPDFPAVLERLKDILLEEEARHAEPSTSPPPGSATANPSTSPTPAAAAAAAGQPPLRKWFKHYKDSADKIPESPPSKNS